MADTFPTTLPQGIALRDFVTAVELLRQEPHSFNYVSEAITEPLGVAGAQLSWKAKIDSLTMVIDVGAGTSDISLFRIHVDPANGKNQAIEIEGAARGISLAGNHLDRMLIELIVKKSGTTKEDPMWINVRSALELEIRQLKETLFNEGSVYVSLLNSKDVEIQLSEFLELEPVRRFGQALRDMVTKSLSSIDKSWINWIANDPLRSLVVTLTGGGANLPMVQALAEGSIVIEGVNVRLAKAMAFPKWLYELGEILEADYPRIAVSLGGARKKIIQSGGTATVTADISQKPMFNSFT